MKRLAILGASSHGKVVAEVALSAGWDSVNFYDDAFPTVSDINDTLIEGDFKRILEQSDHYDGFHVAIGNNRNRLQILNRLIDFGLSCPNLVAPSAVVSQSASLGVGISIMANVVVNAQTAVGNGVVLNTSCSVDHDCIISEGVHISPGAHLAGHVTVGNYSWVGIGSVIIQGKVIGNESIIGAGSVVIDDIPSNVTAVGVPSKTIR